MPKRGSKEHIEIQNIWKDQKKAIEDNKLDVRTTPHFLTVCSVLITTPPSEGRGGSD